MKIGTDGVLIGAWSDHPSPNRILDIGTGTGLVALMLAQRFPQAEITGIEIEPCAFKEAQANFEQSPFANRMTVRHQDLMTFTDVDGFDLVVSNPPYFENDLKPIGENRGAARHSTVGLRLFFERMAHLVNSTGSICVVIPTDREAELCDSASELDLYGVRRLSVRGTAQSSVKRCLLNFSREPSQLVSEEIVIETSRHVYTPEYVALTRDFYLKM